MRSTAFFVASEAEKESARSSHSEDPGSLPKSTILDSYVSFAKVCHLTGSSIMDSFAG